MAILLSTVAYASTELPAFLPGTVGLVTSNLLYGLLLAALMLWHRSGQVRTAEALCPAH